MARTSRDIGVQILQGLQELKHGKIDRLIDVPGVASTRNNTGLSQARFGQLLGVSMWTLQDWQQGR